MKLFFFSLWLIISPSVTFAVPLSDFFDYNRVGNNCTSRSESISANDELSRSDCITLLFPEAIDHQILFNVNISFPFFNETVTTINVSVYCSCYTVCMHVFYMYILYSSTYNLYTYICTFLDKCKWIFIT